MLGLKEAKETPVESVLGFSQALQSISILFCFQI